MPLTLTPSVPGGLTLTLNLPAVFGTPEVLNPGQLIKPQQISINDGQSTSPNTNVSYLTPTIYVERHTNSVVTPQADWGNGRKTAPILVEVRGYANETGELNGIATRIQTTGSPGVGQAGNVAISSQAQTGAGAGLANRDCWGANFCAYCYGTGLPPGNFQGVEVDLVAGIAMTNTIRPGVAGNQRYIGYSAQSTLNTCNAGLWISAFDGVNNNLGPGWQIGVMAEAWFYQWAGWFINNRNAANAGGIYIQTAFANSNTYVFRAASADGDHFTVTGDTNNPVNVKMGGTLYNLVQQNGTGTTTGFVAGAGTAMNSASTSTGATGSTAYTFGDVVKALKNLGLMAA